MQPRRACPGVGRPARLPYRRCVVKTRNPDETGIYSVRELRANYNRETRRRKIVEAVYALSIIAFFAVIVAIACVIWKR